MNAAYSEPTIAPACGTVHIYEDFSASAGPLNSPGDVTIDGNACAGAEIRAAGNVWIGHDANNAHIVSGGNVLVPDGSIVGGRIVSNRNANCRVAGDQSGTRTVFDLGINEAFIDAAERCAHEIEKTFRITNDVRAILEPIQTSRDLTAAQKEQLTELLFRGAEAAKPAIAAAARLRNRMRDMQSEQRSELIVSEALNAGVIITYPGASVTINTTHRGPLKVFVVRTRMGISIQMHESESGKTHILQSAPAPDRIEAIHRMLEKAKPVAVHRA